VIIAPLGQAQWWRGVEVVCDHRSTGASPVVAWSAGARGCSCHRTWEGLRGAQEQGAAPATEPGRDCGERRSRGLLLPPNLGGYLGQGSEIGADWVAE